MTKIKKVLLTGKTHTTASRDGAARGGETTLDLHLSTPNDPNSVIAFAAVLPHPTAEQLFAGAWSACYFAAVQHVAKGQKVELPSDLAVHIEVDLGMDGSAYLLQARLNVSMPGVPRDTAELLVHAADEICPYSKATRGNIEVSLNVIS
ncbi:Ohr family peroxiredoxin [Variovorax paradoxus]|nr:Ohr family peroxiredoxin [Variovorax paradoxus]MBT2304180.1 Ohr family peroxiredoxin [Variovorax paradoxus]